MTAAPLPARLAPARPREASPTPALQLVEAVRYAPGRTPFIILIGAVLSTGLLIVLMLHTFAAQDGFRLHALQARSAALGDSEQQLSIETQQARSPVALAERAKALGMVPTDSLGFLRLRDGQLMGVVKAAPKPPPAPAKPKVTATSAAGAKAAKAAKPGKAAKRAAPTPTPTKSPRKH